MKIEKIIFATGNKDKMSEIREILRDFCDNIISMKEAGVEADIVEDGETFEQNALIKARAVWKQTGQLVISDDSGLEVDALGGEPGIYSSRYMGEDTSYHIKNRNIIERLEGIPDEERTARFVCAAAVIFPNGSEKVVRGVMEGRIGYEEKGGNGFGYDPIFILPEFEKTTAELPAEVKNSRSHRGKALRAVRAEIETYANSDSK
ncbi:MAG: RdgB/HAM1 family non-canonical purine NTP pyrophosphatase [Lachnospiraceae bacterium]|nr:RdgB/HAM1 family non-canonical purine NTP pyrophosphatase [Lachnospiraceae bacterium]